MINWIKTTAKQDMKTNMSICFHITWLPNKKHQQKHLMQVALLFNTNLWGGGTSVSYIYIYIKTGSLENSNFV